MREIKKPSISRGKKILEPGSYDTVDIAIDYPVFCLKHLRGNHGLDICDKNEKAALVSQLSRLSQLTWGQIQLAPRHGLGSEKINKEAIKESIPEFITEDVREFLAFRFKGLAAFIGHRRGPVLHVLFVDPRFDLYKHNK